MLKNNLYSYIGGGINSPNFLKNKIYVEDTKEVKIEYFNLDLVYDNKTSEEEIDQYIKDNKDNLMEEFVDFSYTKITPKDLVEID